MARTPKSPPPPIVAGDRIRKRGLGHKGRVARIGANPGWAHIDWDEGPLAVERPRICDVRELEHDD